jgi:outer membrane receptor protein involved in Fe transport
MLIRKLIVLMILALNLGQLFPAAKVSGSIRGKILDKRTLQPLPGTNIILPGLNRGSASDTSGYYLIRDLNPGSYQLEYHFLGYNTVLKGNVIVNPNRTTVLDIEMEENILQSDAVTVAGSYFEKAKEAVVSSQTMDFEEIRRSPGDILDIQRTMQALPSVVAGSDQINELIVRGGVPGENLFILDNIEIPNPNHFGHQGMNGGPINMLNSYMIRKVDFYAGAFSAKYGDKASSVMDISLRNGSTERLRAEGSINMAGAGILIEGPAGFSNGSYLFSARKSYLDLILSQVGLTAIPRYYNLQGKMTLNLNKQNTLLINGVYGSDEIEVDDDSEVEDEKVKEHNAQVIGGATLRTFWNNHLYSKVTFSSVQNLYDTGVQDKSNMNYLYRNNSLEGEYTAKTDMVYHFNDHLEFIFGGSFKRADFNHDIYSSADTLFWYRPGSSQPDSVFKTYPDYSVKDRIKMYKGAAYGQISFIMFQRLKTTLGLRYDYCEYNTFSSWSPRLGLSYYLTTKTLVNLAYGKHFQTPAYIEFTGNPLNKELHNKYTEHYVIGLEHLLREDTRITLEAYHKSYYAIPISRSVTTADPYDSYAGQLVNRGKGFSCGIELYIQKKLTKGFSGMISYTHSLARAKDPRFGMEYSWDFDFRNVVTLIGGYKYPFYKQSWYRNIRRKFWFALLSLFPLFPSDEYELSMKFNYIGGRPYTQRVYYPEHRIWIVAPDQEFNTQRYPYYQRLDLRIDRRFIFNNWNLVFFLDFINLLGKDNVWGYSYKDDGTYESVLQFQTLPILGITLEF